MLSSTENGKLRPIFEGLVGQTIERYELWERMAEALGCNFGEVGMDKRMKAILLRDEYDFVKNGADSLHYDIGELPDDFGR